MGSGRRSEASSALGRRTPHGRCSGGDDFLAKQPLSAPHSRPRGMVGGRVSFFCPYPPFFETQATFTSMGTTDLRAAQTSAEGTLSLAPGTFALPGQADIRLGIPRLSMAFASRLSYGADFPLLHSDLRLRIGEGERAAEIAVRAEVDGGADQIRMETTGALRYLEDLIGLLPPAWQPLAIQGDFSWKPQWTRFTPHPPMCAGEASPSAARE